VSVRKKRVELQTSIRRFDSDRRLSMLALRSLFFTIVVPGTVTVLIPYLIVSRGGAFVVERWTLLHFLGLILMVVGAAILIRCIWDFAAKGRGTLAPIDPPRHLVVQGLYRYVRNPMYLGVLLMLLGETAFFKSTALLQYTIGWFIVVNLFVLLYEEPALRHQFGDSYEQYFRSVHRWWPTRPAGPDA
jgi:protein-S-isoprenylcysteine O-methyltransferase Ste14